MTTDAPRGDETVSAGPPTTAPITTPTTAPTSAPTSMDGPISTLEMRTDTETGQVQAAALRAAQAAPRRFGPRITATTRRDDALNFVVARPLELPTRLRLTWASTGDGTRVRLRLRAAAGLSPASRRLVDRFVSELLVELAADPVDYRLSA